MPNLNIREWPRQLFHFITAYRPFYNLLLAFYTMMDMFWLGWDGTDPADFSLVLNDYAELVILEGLHGFGAFARLAGVGWDGFEDEDMDMDDFDEFDDFDFAFDEFGVDYR